MGKDGAGLIGTRRRHQCNYCSGAGPRVVQFGKVNIRLAQSAQSHERCVWLCNDTLIGYSMTTGRSENVGSKHSLSTISLAIATLPMHEPNENVL